MAKQLAPLIIATFPSILAAIILLPRYLQDAFAVRRSGRTKGCGSAACKPAPFAEKKFVKDAAAAKSIRGAIDVRYQAEVEPAVLCDSFTGLRKLGARMKQLLRAFLVFLFYVSPLQPQKPAKPTTYTGRFGRGIRRTRHLNQCLEGRHQRKGPRQARSAYGAGSRSLPLER